MNIIEHRGDVFQSPAGMPIAHAVSKRLRMGAGFALNMRSQDIACLKRQHKVVGEVAIGHQDGRRVFNLITKELYFQKPTLDNIRRTFVELKRVCISLNVKELCAPALCSGLDRQPWPAIRSMLQSTFQDILIYVYTSTTCNFLKNVAGNITCDSIRLSS
ncbi:hypothetical protein ABFX02_O011600 [Erythranthe guttata]